jgi:hypothetical protein
MWWSGCRRPIVKVATPAAIFSLQIPAEQVTVVKSPGADTVNGALVKGVPPSVPVAVPVNVKFPVAAKAVPLKSTREKILCIHPPFVRKIGDLIY